MAKTEELKSTAGKKKKKITFSLRRRTSVSERSLAINEADLTGENLFMDDDEETRLTRRSKGKSLLKSWQLKMPLETLLTEADGEESANSQNEDDSKPDDKADDVHGASEHDPLLHHMGFNLRRKPRSQRFTGLKESPSDWLVQGYLKKGEWEVPTQCGCFPMRDRQFHDKFAAIDMRGGALIYAKTRHMILNVSSKKIPFVDISRVEFESPDSNTFRIYIKPLAQERHKGREFYAWSAVDHESAKQWVDTLSHVTFLHATVYNVGPTGTFPEAEIGVQNYTAICFSGGGARSHTATSGYLRALQNLRLLNSHDINYISSVSGSAWATSIYTFYESGAASDDELLGRRTRFDDLNMFQLSEKVHAPILQPAVTDLWRRAEAIFWSTDWHEWWERSVGDIYLEPFGLNDDCTIGHPDMAATMNVQNFNMAQIRMAHRNRPFWLANAAILGPDWARAGDLFPIQFTPMYSGSPFKHRVHLRGLSDQTRHEDVVIGGNMIDSFAFGSETPLPGAGNTSKRPSLSDGLKNGAIAITNAATELVKDVFTTLESLVKDHEEEVHQGVSKRTVLVAAPDRPLTLRHVVGISSHAPAFVFKNSKMMERLNPRNKFWTPSVHLHRDREGSEVGPNPEDVEDMDFADGGTIDNLGILAMLQRRVKRICVFVNSEIPVPLHPHRKRTKSGRLPSIRKSVRRIVRKSRKSLGAESVGSNGSNGGSVRISRQVLDDLQSLVSDDEEDPEDSMYFEEESTIFDGAEAFLPEYEDWSQSSILPLFGIEVPMKGEFGTFAHNHVFRKEKIIGLLEQLQQAKLLGEPLIAEQTLDVLHNEWWGIKGDYEVTVMWVYLEKVRNFELQLPRETTEEIDKGRKGLFPQFPLYKTFGQKKGKIIEPALTIEQANLLSAQCEWTIMQASSRFKSFFRDAEEAIRQEQAAVTENLQEKGFM